MPSKVTLFVIQVMVHVFLYALPRFIYFVFLRLPVALYDYMINNVDFWKSLRKDRLVTVITSTNTESDMQESCVKKFGLDNDVYYNGPMYNGHIHTLLGGARIGNRVKYSREMLLASDGNPICLDWLYSEMNEKMKNSTKVMPSCGSDIKVDKEKQSDSYDNSSNNNSNNNFNGDVSSAVNELTCSSSELSEKIIGRCANGKAILLIVPGVGNYGQTPYLQRLSREAVRQGFHVCVLTPRGMGSAPLTTPSLTCMTFTSDLHHVLHECFNKTAIYKKFGKDLPLFLLGFSAGGSTSIKCIAEEVEMIRSERVKKTLLTEGMKYANGNSKESIGVKEIQKEFNDEIPLAACISVNTPYNIFDSIAALKSRIGELFYQKPMHVAEQKYYKKHRAVLDQSVPILKNAKEEEREELMTKMKNVYDIDKYIVAPHFGYSSPYEYYTDSGAMQYLYKIKEIPVVCISTADDPITGKNVPIDEWQKLININDNIIYIQFPVGGHLSCLGTPVQEYYQQPTYLQLFLISIIDAYINNAQKSL